MIRVDPRHNEHVFSCRAEELVSKITAGCNNPIGLPLGEDVLSCRAQELVSKITAGCKDTFGASLMSISIYDTAWVSLVTKPNSANLIERLWLFPECFFYLLDTQQDDGGWEKYHSQIDAIYNTAAALLALNHYACAPRQLKDVSKRSLRGPIARAESALKLLLNDWDVDSCLHVGYEMLVPRLLDLLQEFGHSFHFPGKESLMTLNKIKLSRFDPKILYSGMKTTALYSLEAFPNIDYDRLCHQKSMGAIMGSTSSTAVYLANVKSFDEEAELYLRHTIDKGPGMGNGGVPGAFPTTYFEITWVLTTLLEAGFTSGQLGLKNVTQLAEVLRKALREENGTIGFAPRVTKDADDTAKCFLTLLLLGDDTVPTKDWIKEFEQDTRFQTYTGERTPSFSANANVLIALLHLKDASDYIPQIQKTAKYICQWWWEAGEVIPDKWNLTIGYNTMLMVQALVRLLSLWSKSLLSDLDEKWLLQTVPVVLSQALSRLLCTQNDDGSWGHSGEETGYAIITISELSRLPHFGPLVLDIQMVVEKAQVALRNPKYQKPAFLWIGKTSYKSELLSETYILAALNTKFPRSLISGPKMEILERLFSFDFNGIHSFYRRLPILSEVPDHVLRASIIEGWAFRPILGQVKREALPIFESDQNAKDSQYTDHIPVPWVICNNMSRTFASPQLLLSMMVVSYMTYKIDELMEDVVIPQFSDNLTVAEFLIRDLFEGHTTSKDTCNNEPNATKSIEEALQQYRNCIINLPGIHGSDPYHSSQVAGKIQEYLLSHLDQARAEKRFGRGKGISATDSSSCEHSFSSGAPDFYSWLHGPAATSISCPYAFSLLVCYISNTNGYFKRCDQIYIADDLCNHLAVMSRLENDWGSMERDRIDKTLNSVDFPEFQQLDSSKEAERVGSLDNDKLMRKKDQGRRDMLAHLVEYERGCIASCLKSLEKLCVGKANHRTLRILKMFTSVCEMYGQIYRKKDLSTAKNGS